METTFSTWTCEAPGPLIGCGIDAERISRFLRYTAGEAHPMPFVFSSREIRYSRSSASPQRSLCASFCCKEALFKAIREPYDFPACELFWDGGATGDVRISRAVRRQYDINEAVARVAEVASDDELVVTVFLFGPSQASPGT